MVAMLPGTACSLTGSPEPSAEPLPEAFMPSDQVRAGMRAVGYTVFRGYEIEAFEVEILGVEHHAMAKTNMILGRVHSPEFSDHGIAQGMSGSPIYIDGKLIGALAYGWSFSYQPICGITPIERMWTVWNNIGREGLLHPKRPGARSGDASGRVLTSRNPGAAASTRQGGWDWEADLADYRAMLEGTAAPSTASGLGWRPTNPAVAGMEGELVPLASPLYLSSVSPRAGRMLSNFFAAQGISVINVGGMAGVGAQRSGGEPAPRIEAGSALGVPLVTGDLSISGVGTVTYREGDRLLAFGHPMFGRGPAHMPLAPARMFEILRNYNTSFKLGEVGEPVGHIDQDRLFAVGGVLGPPPRSVPLTVSIRGSAVSDPQTFHFSLWEDSLYLPTFGLSCMAEAFDASVSGGGEQTARCSYEILLRDGRRFHKRQIDSSDGPAVISTLSSLLQDLYLLYDNPFAEGELASIDVRFDVEPGLHEEALIGLSAPHTTLEAGETIQLRARFQPWRAPEYERSISFALPADLAPGFYILHMTDASGSQRILRARQPALFSPRSFDDVLELVDFAPPLQTSIELGLYEPVLGTDVSGHSLGSLPSSVEPIVQKTAPPLDLGETVGRRVAGDTLRLAAPVYGSQSMLIEVVAHLDR